jgi:hypothetical protein
MATTVTFFSNFTEHELVRQPRNDKPLPSGTGWINDFKGVKYKFKPAVDESGQLVGRLDVHAGQDVLVDTMGWLAPGIDSVERDAPSALRAHRAFKRDFWEMPTPAANVRGQIRKFSVALDHDGLAALISTEQATFNRADLIAEAKDALELVKQTQAELTATAEQQQADEYKTPNVTPVEAPKPKAKAKPKDTE